MLGLRIGVLMTSLQTQIEQQVKEQNWRVVDNVLNLNACCEWAEHKMGYDNSPAFSHKKKLHHHALGGLRACRNCWVCFFLGRHATAATPARNTCKVMQTPKTPKPKPKHVWLSSRLSSRHLWDYFY